MSVHADVVNRAERNRREREEDEIRVEKFIRRLTLISRELGVKILPANAGGFEVAHMEAGDFSRYYKLERGNRVVTGGFGD